ncbi:MAG: mechanosensitive ion channel family protein, partial [Eubacteriales bacterium]
MTTFFKELLMRYALSETAAAYVAAALTAALAVLLCWAAELLSRKIFLRWLAHAVRKNNRAWGRALLERRVFHRLAHVTPAVIIYHFAPAFPAQQTLIQRVALFYLLAAVLMSLSGLLSAVGDVYQRLELAKSRPIKGLLQMLRIALLMVGGITLVSVFLDKSPLLLLSGLGALSAVLLLIFKDSILGFVAGVQLASNDMVRVGDWVEMPKYDADGDVIDITLHTVKVQNWDMTITMVPAYAFISDSFKNWRGMQEMGGRRIKRAVYIDATSIRFCTAQTLARFRQIQLLTDYLLDKEADIAAYNRAHRVDPSTPVNGRHLTNIGTFRIYMEKYLEQHPMVHHGMVIMVRQLAAEDRGVPLEVYCFTGDTRWEVYERVQADIFDHIFAVAPEFELRIFQQP